MKRILFTLICSAFFSIVLSAQESIRVSAPNLVEIGEQFVVAFSIEGEDSPSDFQWEPGADFQLVFGPSTQHSSSISIVNGKRTSSKEVKYSYVLLPRSAGKFQLPSAVATIKNNRIVSRQISIEVVGENASPKAGEPDAGAEAASRPSSSAGKSQDDIVLKLVVGKTNVVVGELVPVSLKLYKRCEIAGFEDAKFPQFNGFWSEEKDVPSNIQFHREKLGDQLYDAALLRSWILTPQQAGEIKIEPAELVCVVNVLTRRAPTGSPFDAFFQDDISQVRKRIYSGAVTMHVKNLPSGAPDSFGGGVGSFRMSASLTRDSLATHDAASLNVVISGTGNLSMLQAPKVVLPPDFEAYDVKVSEKSGSRIFEFPFIPRSSGEFVIPSVEYSYFDLNTGKYVKLKSGEMPVKVSRSTESESSGQVQTVQGVSKKDVKDLGSDIRFISNPVPRFHPSGSFFVGSPLFYVISALLFAAFWAILFALRSAAARRADVAATRGRGANKMARKRLSVAGGYLKNNLQSAFYEELHRALLGYISDKLNIDSSGMSRENITARLQESGVPSEVIDSFVSLLDACEFARYAPESGHEAMNSHYESAVSVISSMDSCLKKKSSASIAAIAALVMFVSLPFDAYSQSPDSLWHKAVEAYAAGQWSAAGNCWEQIAGSGLESPELYYNIGNARFKDGDLAHSILWYERALKLDPSYSDARYNLEFANSKCLDRIDSVPEFFLVTWARGLSRVFNSDAWAVIFLVFLAAFLGLTLLFILSSDPIVRRVGFFSAIAALLISLLALTFSIKLKKDWGNRDAAIVVSAVSAVKSSPGDDVSTNLFILHEGTKVNVVEKVGDWNRIELSDGRQGWIKFSEIEVI